MLLTASTPLSDNFHHRSWLHRRHHFISRHPAYAESGEATARGNPIGPPANLSRTRSLLQAPEPLPGRRQLEQLLPTSSSPAQADRELLKICPMLRAELQGPNNYYMLTELNPSRASCRTVRCRVEPTFPRLPPSGLIGDVPDRKEHFVGPITAWCV